MCAPVILAAAAGAGGVAATGGLAALGTMSGLATAASIGSGVMSVVGAYQQSQAANAAADAQRYAAQEQAKASDRQAAIQEAQAKDAEARGAEAAQQVRMRTRQAYGAQRAALAHNGLELNAGTPLQLQEDTNFFGAMDENTVKSNAAKEAWGYRVGAETSTNNANLQRYGAATTRSNSSPLLAAGSTLLTSGAQVADRWLRNNPTTTKQLSAFDFGT